MARHSSGGDRSAFPIAILIAIPIVLLGAGAAVAAVFGGGESSSAPQTAGIPVASAAKCTTTTPLTVVTAKSFAPVLEALAPTLATGTDCARLDVKVIDGRAAAQQIAKLGADVWIPDDTSWATVAGGAYAEYGDTENAAAEKPVVVATSPLYFVTDKTTAGTVRAAGGSWLGLAELVKQGKPVNPVLRAPGGTGDGLLAAGALGEAVWLRSGMDVSAEYLAEALGASRTVPGDAVAKPAKASEVGLVPEYALLKPGWSEDQVVMAPSDHTAELRYTWLPDEQAAKQPATAKAMTRLLETLRGPQASDALSDAGLRGPGGQLPQSAETRRLPKVSAKPLDVLAAHHITHVFATWYPADRRSDILVVVDVSGSMGEPAPGTQQPLIRSVARGTDRLGALLPNDSRLALWEFGSRIDGAKDYRPVLGRAALSTTHRRALATATRGLAARPTGTGLYDTLLASYRSARDSFRGGRTNQVVLFTDGLNQDDPGSITAAQLTAALKKASDPKRPVALSVITFGQEKQAEALEKVLAPIDGSVKVITNAAQVDPLFIHVAAGGLEH